MKAYFPSRTRAGFLQHIGTALAVEKVSCQVRPISKLPQGLRVFSGGRLAVLVKVCLIEDFSWKNPDYSWKNPSFSRNNATKEKKGK